MRLLDLFCGAGGAAMGYSRAGFTEIVGVDTKPQPRYPFRFFELDAMDVMSGLLSGGTVMGYRLHDFDAFHASPPCQGYSEQTPLRYRDNHPRLIGDVRARLLATGKPWAIENVENARGDMLTSVMLCGTMFGLNLWRHRYFECYPVIAVGPATCCHVGRPVTPHPCSNSRAIRMGPVAPTGSTRRKSGRFEWGVEACRDAMEIPWMVREEIDQAIPPAYTEWVGRQLLSAVAA